MRRAAGWIIWTGALFAFWLLLVDTVDLAQLVAGVVTAALAATAALLVEDERDLRLRPRARCSIRGASAGGCGWSSSRSGRAVRVPAPSASPPSGSTRSGRTATSSA